MIDPRNPADRARLSRAMDYWYREHAKYRVARRETVQNHAGSPQWLESMGEGNVKPIWGNLIQLSALAHSLTLAYAEPRYLAVANIPEAADVAPRLAAFLNRYTKLIGLGDIARAVALDSYFGYGIIHVANGLLPVPAQIATGNEYGPAVRRISQDHFIFDGSATTWDEVSFMGHFYDVPLEDARSFGPFVLYNPEGAASLEEFNVSDANVDAQLHEGDGHTSSAENITRLVDVYLPGANLLATWPAANVTFSGVQGEPLWVRKYDGHHTGPYAILSHLDVPDNLIPVTQAEGVKQLHFLFNELADRVAVQSREAKVVPVYETGSDRDMERLEGADDRKPVGVSNLQKIGTWEKPGPSQSQTSYMLAVQQMFKEFSGNLDDTLGLAPTASTATQSQLIRQSNNVRSAEARRRMDRMMELVAHKLAHLALNHESLRLSARERVGSSNMYVDMGWEPPGTLPRSREADEYEITIVPGSMAYRPPEARLGAINEATGQIFQAMQLTAQGAPLDLEKFIEMQAKYRDLPELRDLYIGALPDHAERTEAAEMGRMRDPSRGQYTRTNASERTGAGALAEAMQQAGDSPSGVQTPE